MCQWSWRLLKKQLEMRVLNKHKKLFKMNENDVMISIISCSVVFVDTFTFIKNYNYLKAKINNIMCII